MPEQCVYIDEAGIDNSLDYAYGWSLKGRRCWAEKLGHFTQRVSMIAAYCQKHVFAAKSFTGHCNSERVETWFEQTLIPQLQTGQVVILDNASFHRKAVLQAMLDKVDCQLLPLPPYSPDLNDIEHVWNKVKALVRHNTDEALSLQDKLDHALCSL